MTSPDSLPPRPSGRPGQEAAELAVAVSAAVTYDQAETQYNIVTAGKRYEELTDRDLCARTAATLRERGEFNPDELGHQILAEREPLTVAERLEHMALGEMLARYYRHPAELDTAAKAGATWEQIGAARGTSVDQARRDYREWAEGQHSLLSYKDGRFGMSDEEYAAALTRAGSPRVLVTFDLTDDRDTDFVLTEALREFAGRQHAEAADEEPGSPIAADRLRWAQAAEAALDRVENPEAG